MAKNDTTIIPPWIDPTFLDAMSSTASGPMEFEDDVTEEIEIPLPEDLDLDPDLLRALDAWGADTGDPDTDPTPPTCKWACAHDTGVRDVFKPHLYKAPVDQQREQLSRRLISKAMRTIPALPLCPMTNKPTELTVVLRPGRDADSGYTAIVCIKCPTCKI